MPLRRWSLCTLLAAALALAGDGISPLHSAADYPAHVTSGKIEIGASWIAPAQAKKLFGDDLDKKGYVVFEIGIFPDGQAEIAADDFKLRQGKDTSIVRAATPHMVAAEVYPDKTRALPKLPAGVTVVNHEEIIYEPGRGVYHGGGVGVGVGNPRDVPPPPPQQTHGSQAGLEQQLEVMALPEGKFSHPVAGYIFFPKPSTDKRADYELLYFGFDGQVSLKLTPKSK